MSFYTSLSGLKAAQLDLSVTANNVANVGSMGFKRSRAEFGDIMPPSSTSAGIGARLKTITQQFTQGGFETSSRELDLAINGTGFFVTRDSASGGDTYLTRNGSLSVSSDRYVIDSNRNYIQVLPVDASGNATSTDLTSATSLQLPAANASGSALSSIDIDRRGLVTATYADGTTEPLGALMVANVPNPEGLQQQGNARWSITGGSGPATGGVPGTAGLGTVESGMLERANVDITEELVGLITAQRNFQANAKAIETANAITQTITNLRT